MTIRPYRLLAVLMLFIPAAILHAQAKQLPAIPQFSLGEAAVSLNGPWKFNTGDSPIDPKTGRYLWAEPGFDDSAWENVSLKPMPGWKDPYNGDPRYLPGWTARGHAGYIGYAWYRMRFHAVTDPPDRLAMSSPIYVDDGYQIFANGVLLGGIGKFDIPGRSPRVTSTTPAAMLIPESKGGPDAAPGMYTIAFRVWMGPMGLTHSPYAGGLHYAPWLGVQSAIAEHTRLDWQRLVVQSAYASFESILLFLLGIIAAGLILFDRSDSVYLWLSAVFIFTAVSDAVLTIFTLTSGISLRAAFIFFDVFSNPLILCGWIMVWWYWFRLKRPSWFPGIIAALMLLYMVTKIIGGDFLYRVNPHPPVLAFGMISVAVRLAFLPLFIFVVVLGIRKQGTEGWFVLPAVLPLLVAQFASDLFSHNLAPTWAPFGITIYSGQLANMVSTAAIALLLLRRLLLSIRRQRQMAIDVKQAQEVQKVILPEQHVILNGFAIETEYRPASEVGGDFFQVIPNKEDGSLLIVAGDVTGKGLKAGMLVALLVGAIRSTAEWTREPAEILRALNQRLIGRGDAPTTCLALNISASGAATLANAGHLPPYLNGKPLAVDGSLPLGLVQQHTCSILTFQLSENDRLLLLTDGVPEATDSKGQLFGFDRVLDLLRSTPTAVAIAQAAQSFGQEDDISVITVTRLGAAAS
ncbi:MAG: serine/threonine-protein phosphatase [Acidobacteriota bacterium]|nr:serine/threonine-protein phosphatase [Acidobacteriota bacterium]